MKRKNDAPQIQSSNPEVSGEPTHARPSNPDTLTRAVLSTLESSSSAMEGFRIEGPKDGGLRMRKLVHRGTQRPVHRVASLRLGRPVQCESALEYEATLLLDVCSRVQSFAEQPARIHYFSNEKWHSHIPDVLLIVNSKPTFWELKFFTDLDEEIESRTRLMSECLGKLGVGYQLITEKDIRRRDCVQNALQVLRRARHADCPVQELATLNRLRSADRFPLSSFGWREARSPVAPLIAKLIFDGFARVDSFETLTDGSYVMATSTSNEKEVSSWLPAAFA